MKMKAALKCNVCGNCAWIVSKGRGHFLSTAVVELLSNISNWWKWTTYVQTHQFLLGEDKIWIRHFIARMVQWTLVPWSFPTLEIIYSILRIPTTEESANVRSSGLWLVIVGTSFSDGGEQKSVGQKSVQLSGFDTDELLIVWKWRDRGGY